MSEKKTTQGAGSFEVPEEMRQFAEQSVNQVRKAFGDVLGASRNAVDAVDMADNPVQASALDMSRQAIGYAEENVTAALDLAEAMAQAGSVEEIANLQREYLKSQMTVFGEQTRAFGESMSKMAEKTAKSMKGE